MSNSNLDSLSRLPKVREFLDATASMLPAYRFGVFSFVALLHDGDKVILRARLDLCASLTGPQKRAISTANLWAGQVRLELDPSGIENSIRSAVTGARLPFVGEHLLKLAPPQQTLHAQDFSAAYERLDQMSVEKLIISGAHKHQLLGSRAMAIEVEVGELGFDSLESLMRVYGLRGSDDTTLEIVPGPVAFIRAAQLTALQARICFSLAKGIQKDRLRINSRSVEPNAEDVPLVLSGSDVTWDESTEHCVGEWVFDLPSPAIIECKVLYSGRPQARIRLEDRNCLPNPWRMVLKLVAPDLTDLEKLLIQPHMKQAREFEIAVAWLLQILGFGAVHVGSVIKKSEGPDDIAMAPDGTVLVIECTIDAPDDDKLTKLISRSARLRELLQKAHRETTVIPLLVTPLAAAELAGIRQKAEKHSILVLSRSELEHALERSKFALDPNGMLQYWRQLPLMRLMTEGLSVD